MARLACRKVKKQSTAPSVLVCVCLGRIVFSIQIPPYGTVLYVLDSVPGAIAGVQLRMPLVHRVGIWTFGEEDVEWLVVCQKKKAEAQR